MESSNISIISCKIEKTIGIRAYVDSSSPTSNNLGCPKIAEASFVTRGFLFAFFNKTLEGLLWVGDETKACKISVQIYVIDLRLSRNYQCFLALVETPTSSLGDFAPSKNTQ